MNQSSHEIQGVYTAIVTPFQSNFEIDWPTYERLIEEQIAAGIHGLVICGTTGESPTLTAQEKLALIKKAKALSGGRTKIMAGTGGNNTQQSIELSRLAQDAGADSLLIVTPYYNKPTLAGLIHHYSAIRQAVKIPLCLYHVPSRTGQLLQADAIATIAREVGIAAVKEASGDMALFARCVQRLPKVQTLSGDDATFLASLGVGGRGVISVLSNLLPGPMLRLYEAQQQGRMAESLEWNRLLLPLMDLSMCETNPGPIKAMLHLEKKASDALRAPLWTVVPENLERLQKGLQAYKDGLASSELVGRK